ncbi:hypothetical protein [Stackebrandtia soli]|uniref:hypothetical protein n=1 Tax=Stackebrandtia soli TaxID=1892856 RepID=UPI0039ED4329
MNQLDLLAISAGATRTVRRHRDAAIPWRLPIAIAAHGDLDRAIVTAQRIPRRIPWQRALAGIARRVPRDDVDTIARIIGILISGSGVGLAVPILAHVAALDPERAFTLVADFPSRARKSCMRVIAPGLTGTPMLLARALDTITDQRTLAGTHLDIARALGDVDAAREHFDKAVVLCRGLTYDVPKVELYSRIAVETDDLVHARRLLSEASAFLPMSGFDADHARSAYAKAWARHDLDTALSAGDNIRDPELHAAAITDIAVEIAPNQPEQAERLVFGDHHGLDTRFWKVWPAVRVATAITEPTAARRVLATATQFAARLPDDRIRAVALTDIARALVSTDDATAATVLDAALDAANRLTPETGRGERIGSIAEVKARLEPDHALRIVETITEDDRRAAAIAGVAVTIGKTDPALAASVATTPGPFAATVAATVSLSLAGTVPGLAATLLSFAERETAKQLDVRSYVGDLTELAAALRESDPQQALACRRLVARLSVLPGLDDDDRIHCESADIVLSVLFGESRIDAALPQLASLCDRAGTATGLVQLVERLSPTGAPMVFALLDVVLAALHHDDDPDDPALLDYLLEPLLITMTPHDHDRAEMIRDMMGDSDYVTRSEQVRRLIGRVRDGDRPSVVMLYDEVTALRATWGWESSAMVATAIVLTDVDPVGAVRLVEAFAADENRPNGTLAVLARLSAEAGSGFAAAMLTGIDDAVGIAPARNESFVFLAGRSDGPSLR